MLCASFVWTESLGKRCTFWEVHFVSLGWWTKPSQQFLPMTQISWIQLLRDVTMRRAVQGLDRMGWQDMSKFLEVLRGSFHAPQRLDGNIEDLQDASQIPIPTSVHACRPRSSWMSRSLWVSPWTREDWWYVPRCKNALVLVKISLRSCSNGNLPLKAYSAELWALVIEAQSNLIWSQDASSIESVVISILSCPIKWPRRCTKEAGLFFQLLALRNVTWTGRKYFPNSETNRANRSCSVSLWSSEEVLKITFQREDTNKFSRTISRLNRSRFVSSRGCGCRHNRWLSQRPTLLEIPGWMGQTISGWVKQVSFNISETFEGRFSNSLRTCLTCEHCSHNYSVEEEWWCSKEKMQWYMWCCCCRCDLEMRHELMEWRLNEQTKSIANCLQTRLPRGDLGLWGSVWNKSIKFSCSEFWGKAHCVFIISLKDISPPFCDFALKWHCYEVQLYAWQK